MAEDIRRMKSVRGSYKGHCTQEVKKAERLMESEPCNVTELSALLDRLTRRSDEISRMDTKIALLTDEEDIEKETEDALSFQDTISDCTFKIMQALKTNQQENPVSSFHDSNSLGKAAVPRININLPKLSIKSFDGNSLEWLTFWDSFSAAIDENSGLNDIEKMNYLHGMLKGEAARAIAGLPLSKENYTKAIEILKERFGDKQNLINAYMESLSRAPAPFHDIASLRAFYDTCEANIRGLEALNVTTDSYGSLLIPILLKKLPESMRCAIFRADQSADKSLDKLRIALRREIETKEKSHLPSVTKEQESYEEEPLVPTAGAMLSRAQRPQHLKSRVKPRNCAYCNGDHRSDSCHKLTTVQERYSLLQRQQRCFNCLGTNHTKARCFSKRRCLKCKKKHHTSICNETSQGALNETTSNQSTTKKEEESTDNTSIATPDDKKAHMGSTRTTSHRQGQILMQTATAIAIGNGARQSRVHILFDTGSQRTFITQDMKNKLNLKAIRQETLSVTTFGNLESNTQQYDVVTLMLHARNENLPIIALVTPVICPPLSANVFEIPPELKGLKLADELIGNSEVNIVIGNDHFGQLITGKMIKTSNEAIIAMESKFGWLLSGPTSNNCNETTIRCQRTDVQPADAKLDNTLTKFWEISLIPNESKPDISVIKTFEETIRFNEMTGRYSVDLPWKENKNDLPSNLSLCVKRLTSLQRSLNKKDQELIKKYDNQLRDQLQLGFIEKVADLNNHEGILHYIPHFPVFKEESATTKMRIVYDASAKCTSKSLSLNDCLHTGENLMQDLTGILIKFRNHNIAFTADIEKAFLQIELHASVRDATRFLCLKDIDKLATDPDNLQAYRFQRVLFGATSSPFLLIATIQYHLKEINTWIAKDLTSSMYMDNVVTGADCEERAIEYYTRSRDYLQQAGMNLRQWISNSSNLNTKAGEDNAAAGNTTVKVLGLVWNTTSDTISLSLEKMINEIGGIDPISKRTVLSITSKLFDPLGLVEPVTVKAKIMMQDLWKERVDWDQKLTSDCKQQWLNWLSNVKNLSSLKIPRRYFSKNVTHKQLHIFCDSSQQAYGAVAYLRGISDGKPSTSFLIAKTRIAPVKQQTLPRLELMAALLGSNLSAYLTKTLQLDKECEIIYWSDSQIVISWLSSKKKLPQFVHTRVRKIKEITGPYTWRFCPSSTNPADLLTRGMNTTSFYQNKTLWFLGPPWLQKSEDQWPNIQIPKNLADTESPQMGITIKSEEPPNILNLIDITRYSTLSGAIRAIALLVHCARIWKQRKGNLTLTNETIREARYMLLKDTQRKFYDREILFLKKKTESKQPAIIHQLGLYLDEKGLLRCRGRLQYTELPHDTKFPILLYKDDYLTTLIIRNTHAMTMHGGLRETLTQLRQTFWIPQGRQLVKKIISKCVTCRRHEGPSLRSVPTPPLPVERVSKSRAFQYTGIDYAGPLYIRNRNQTSTKVYICLFTCAAIRALHLELVEDQTAEAFLRAFRRFVSRRGVPETIISDNSKTFKAAAQDIKELSLRILTLPKSQQFFTNNGIKWKFIAERAPWWGGFYERLVGMTKRCLKKTIGRASLNMIELNTLLTEVEAVLNSRPLTYPYVGLDDAPPLTPAHFLCGYRLLALPDHEKETDPDYVPFGISARELVKRARYYEKTMQTFWARWQKEYLTGLREHHYQRQGTAHQKAVAKGDVVLIHDDTPRICWKMGIVTKLHPGKDGLVRSVSVRISSGRELCRPIEKLYPMEVQEETTDTEVPEPTQEEPEKNRPKRLAAERAMQRIKELNDE